MTRSKAMDFVGDKESSELDGEEVSSCSWVDKIFNSMNDMEVSCKFEARYEVRFFGTCSTLNHQF